MQAGAGYTGTDGTPARPQSALEPGLVVSALPIAALPHPGGRRRLHARVPGTRARHLDSGLRVVRERNGTARCATPKCSAPVLRLFSLRCLLLAWFGLIAFRLCSLWLRPRCLVALRRWAFWCGCFGLRLTGEVLFLFCHWHFFFLAHNNKPRAANRVEAPKSLSYRRITTRYDRCAANSFPPSQQPSDYWLWVPTLERHLPAHRECVEPCAKVVVKGG